MGGGQEISEKCGWKKVLPASRVGEGGGVMGRRRRRRGDWQGMAQRLVWSLCTRGDAWGVQIAPRARVASFPASLGLPVVVRLGRASSWPQQRGDRRTPERRNNKKQAILLEGPARQRTALTCTDCCWMSMVLRTTGGDLGMVLGRRCSSGHQRPAGAARRNSEGRGGGGNIRL